MRWSCSDITWQTGPEANSRSTPSLTVEGCGHWIASCKDDSDQTVTVKISNNKTQQCDHSLQSTTDLAPDDKLETVKKMILDTALKTLGSRTQKPKQNWIKYETLQLTEQRRKLKEQSSLPTEEYNHYVKK